jgi:calcium-translocating P-type ATPase
MKLREPRRRFEPMPLLLAERAHAAPVADVLDEQASTRTGLSQPDAAARLLEHGPNVTPSAPRDRAVDLVLRQLGSPLIVVLIVAGLLAIALGDEVDGAVVLAVVVANTLIGFMQEWRAGRAIDALGAMLPEQASVIRDGRRATVPATEVVPGDVLALAAGDRVPADARLLEAAALQVDEAALTGESLPVPKGPEPVDAGAVVADRTSMVHGGTLVTSGTGVAVVVATGRETELGRIATMLHRAEGVQTPMTRRLAHFARSLSAVICVIAAALFAVALVRGYTALEATLAAIALAVAAIPEGLPAIVTIALAIGVQRMARRRAIVRRLPAVETLGSTTVICTDKTGTLTANRMRVAVVWTPGSRVWRAPSPEAAELLEAGALCNDGEPDGPAEPTEAALLEAAAAAEIDVAQLRARLPRVDELPFDGALKLMVTLHDDGVARMKGAPEAVLPRSGDGRGASAAVEAMASRGMRVLAVARRDARDASAAVDGWTLLGLVAMIDPARPDAIDAVTACRDAGIEVKMITGDHLATARSIGHEFGLGRDGRTGAALDALGDEAFAAAAREVDVFARVAPEHKLRLVHALQRDGQVVAMTGDGVNDAPALKQADIGIAMGAGGTATAREAADLVLTDDDFASIAAAVEEGRRVYDNIRKAIAFVLPTNLGEALIVLLAVLLFPFEGGEPVLPIEPTQILWVNLIATVTLALPLAAEAREPGLMRRGPRAPGSPLLDGLVLWRTVAAALLMTAAALLTFALVRDAGDARGQTAAVTAIVLFQAFYLLECRSLDVSAFRLRTSGNPWVWAGIAAVLLLQLAFIYLPPLQSVFGSAALRPSDWLIALAAAASVVPLVEADKRQRRSA